MITSVSMIAAGCRDTPGANSNAEPTMSLGQSATRDPARPAAAIDDELARAKLNRRDGP